MNQLDLDKINNNLYEEGKIYWEEGKNYTSKLLESLLSFGYKVKCVNGISSLYDREGFEVAYGMTRVQFLVDVANQFR